MKLKMQIKGVCNKLFVVCERLLSQKGTVKGRPMLICLNKYFVYLYISSKNINVFNPFEIVSFVSEDNYCKYSATSISQKVMESLN